METICFVEKETHAEEGHFARSPIYLWQGILSCVYADCHKEYICKVSFHLLQEIGSTFQSFSVALISYCKMSWISIKLLKLQNSCLIYFSQCARNGDVKSAKILISNMGGHVKKKINILDEDDLTPLHYAARHNHLNMLKLLVEHQAGTLTLYQMTKFQPSPNWKHCKWENNCDSKIEIHSS